MGPPARVIQLGEFTHTCEGFMICKATHVNCPLINRPVFYENKDKIGVVDEVFGPINAFVNINLTIK
jgi:H/ACA ribonucleoprotein complex subunit 1